MAGRDDHPTDERATRPGGRLLLVAAVVAVAHLVLSAVVAPRPPIEVLLPVEVGLLALLLLVDARRGRDSGPARVRQLGVLAVAFATLTGGTWLLVATATDLWVSAGTLAAVVALVGYGLHRYELVALGLVTEADA